MNIGHIPFIPSFSEIMRHHTIPIFRKLFAVLLLSLSSFFFASIALAQGDKQCVPFVFPLAGVPCGEGYVGTKFPLREKHCPQGNITEGERFDISGCRPANQPRPEPNATNCAINPQDLACTPAPTGQGGQPGMHWVLTGSKVAHCVLDDFDCGWGKHLEHDGLGNPFCVPNTCPSNQVLQGDGVSCACASGLMWDGMSCVPVCVPQVSKSHVYAKSVTVTKCAA